MRLPGGGRVQVGSTPVTAKALYENMAAASFGDLTAQIIAELAPPKPKRKK